MTMAFMAKHFDDTTIEGFLGVQVVDTVLSFCSFLFSTSGSYGFSETAAAGYDVYSMMIHEKKLLHFRIQIMTLSRIRTQ